ncbi:hypothetical protein [Paraglaciecola sp. MB-3u-78]|uniref:hypothetical protein n=1 Tax=Paraglaciecola sp. MB-3u-78 TaxID=2058332 RepID=UPI0018E2CD38|nr:hypothetical protein [Paraglaciecola sp. MB-3u-78]
MSLDNPKGIESSVSKNTKQRRTFLKRTAAGAVIASIPGRSAWAGIAGSIVASGHGSDFNGGAATMLLDACQVADRITGTFSSYFGFGVSPINGTGDLSAEYILRDGDPDPSNVNAAILIMLFNAVNHGSHGINYPVLSQHNNIPSNFADYLYTQASADPSGVASLLWSTIGTNSLSGSSVICPAI